MVNLGAIPISKLFIPQPTVAASSFPAISPYAWIDATQQAVLADGTIAPTLQDNAVSGRTYANGNGTYQSSVRNGKPAIRMDAGYRPYTPSIDIAVSGTFLFWAVLKPSNPGYLFFNGSLNNQLRFSFGGSRTIAIYNGDLIQSDAFTLAEFQAWQYVMVTRDASDIVKFFYNGGSRSISPPTLSGGLDFNSFLGGSGGALQCDFGEAGFAALPAQADIDALSAYLVSKWGF